MAKSLDVIGISRRDLVRQLILNDYKNINNFCTETGEDYGAIYRYLNKDVRIGDKVIKRLEKLFNKPTGYFDQQLPKATTVDIPIISNIVNKDMSLSEILSASQKSAMLEQRTLEEFNWKKESLFIVIAKDNSMHPIIRDKAEVIVDNSQNQIENNKIYVIKINSEIYIRKLIKSPITGIISLIPENKQDFPTDEINPTDDFTVLGKVVYLKVALE